MITHLQNQPAGERTAAIVLAAGSGKRMGTAEKKQFMLLDGRPVLFYCLKAFQDSFVDDIIVVASPEDTAYIRETFVERYGITKISAIVPGGKERYHSVAAGLQALSEKEEAPDIVFIHDGARPFINEEILVRCLEDARATGACVAAVPAKDTIRLCDEDGIALSTPNRNNVWQMQTPQVFRFPLIKEAYDCLLASEEDLSTRGISITDDAQAVELFTENQVKMTLGSYNNFKITTPEDIPAAVAILNTEKK